MPIILAFLVVFATSADARINTMYNSLNKNVGLQGVTVSINNDSTLNAYVSCGSIYINKGVLKLSDDEVAFILAHEMGHIALGHNYRNKYGQCAGRTVWKKSEQDADNYAQKAMNGTGYSYCRGGIKFFERFIKKYGASPDDPNDTHPSDSQRLAEVKKRCGVD